jgi:hypothetical protein
LTTIAALVVALVTPAAAQSRLVVLEPGASLPVTFAAFPADWSGSD